jgi:hypothetical protein
MPHMQRVTMSPLRLNRGRSRGVPRDCRSKKKSPAEGKLGRVTQKADRRASGGTLVVHRGLRVFEIDRSVFRANLHCLHAGFGFGLGLEHTVINDGRRGGRLLVDNGTLLRRRVPHDVVFGRDSGLRKGRSTHYRDGCACKQKFFHSSIESPGCQTTGLDN